MRIVSQDVSDLRGVQVSPYTAETYQRFFAAMSRMKTLTYGDAVDLAYEHFDWYSWPSRVVRELLVLGKLAWVPKSPKESLRVLISKIPREKRPLWERALESRR